MPISPENRHRYPANWKEIRAKILEQETTVVNGAEQKIKNPIQ
jgi:hypothetical protein